LWIPEGREVDGLDIKKVNPVIYNFKKKPIRLWSLVRESDRRRKPELPIEPVHLENAFLEDRIHDWDINKGYLRYYSRVSEGGLWILLEFEKGEK